MFVLRDLTKTFQVFLSVIMLVLLVTTSIAFAEILDPATIPKYVAPMVIPPAMPYVSKDGSMTVYNIAARQFQQQILPSGLPQTTVWGYGATNGPAPGAPGSTFNYPAFTVETRSNDLVRVKWVNGLVDSSGSYVPHLLPVDPTLHWANPPGPRDHRPEFINTPGPYRGPVPLITHVHGAHVPAISDGYPEAWYLPDATNIPSDYFTRGTFFDSVLPAETGAAWFEYPNTQRATTLWYHDHALGMTRLNVYAGLAGFWLVRDAYEDSLNLPGPAPRLGDAPGTKYYELPIAIQDRTFNTDGSLFYPDSRTFFDDYEEGPFMPDTPVSPIWNPEFFGNTMLVNGNTWPYLDVEPRKYRLRLLNGCNSRFLILKIVSNPLAGRPVATAVNFSQIGNEGGLIPNGPIVLEQLLMSPAERADVIVDFSKFTVGTEVYLINEGPDEPFGGMPVEETSDPGTTGQVMKFRVVAASAPDTSALPAAGALNPEIPAFGSVAKTRDLTLNELAFMPDDVPTEAHLGTGEYGSMSWDQHISEMPMLGDTEVWRLINLTADSHPIHLHLVMFEVLGRMQIDAEAYRTAQSAYINAGRVGTPPDPLSFSTGPMIQPNSWERGTKDTVIANPSELTLVKAMFDLPGLYVWHCHILEHEDNEMMRPYMVVDNQCSTFNSVTGVLHVPCIDLGSPFAADLSLINADPIQFTLAGLVQGQESDQCASYGMLSGILHIPCIDLGTKYSADFSTTSTPTAPFVFELMNFQIAP